MTPTTPPTPPLDFAAIRSSCPKAFAALCEWGNLCDPRDLYDFFDQQGLYVTVEKCYAFWKWTIWNESGYPLRWSNDLAGYPTRAAAEAAAFTAGFAKLEEILKQKEG